MIGFRVLIIDDDVDAVAPLREYLALAGYDVAHAPDGDAGLKRIGADAPDVVLLDIQMPVKDGFHVLGEIRRNPRMSDLPVLLVSHFDRPNLKVKGLEMGADDYIAKPFDSAELLARVKAALRRSARVRWIASSLDGDLGDVPLAILLQTLGLGDKCARIMLDDPSAEILVEKGCFVAARAGALSGEEALLRLLFGARGKFHIVFGKPGSAQGPRVDEVLLRVSTALDEVNAVLTDGPGLEEWVIIKEGTLKFPRKSGDAPAGALSLRRFLIERAVPLHEAARAAVDAWRRSVPGASAAEAA